MRQDLGIYWSVAKSYRGPLHQACRWLNSFGLIVNLLFEVVNPGVDTGEKDLEAAGWKRDKKNLVNGQLGKKDLGMV